MILDNIRDLLNEAAPLITQPTMAPAQQVTPQLLNKINGGHRLNYNEYKEAEMSNLVPGNIANPRVIQMRMFNNFNKGRS